MNLMISAKNHVKYRLTEPYLLNKERKKSNYDYKSGSPLVSVYIPTYNRCELLTKRAIPSILEQTYNNFELIIVGDCCTDNTENEVLKIRDDRIRFINLPTRGYRYPPTALNHWLAGPVVAANKALEMVKGVWIARTDDDDIWTSDHLEKLLRAAQERNLEFISASYTRLVEGKEETVKASDFDPPIGGTQTWLYKEYLKFFKYNIDCWRKSWNRVNDIDLQIRMHEAGVHMGYIEDVVCQIIPRPGEDLVGSKAYLAKQAEYEKFYDFN